MYAPTLIVAPAIRPVTVDEAKTHLRVDYAEEDDLIGTFIDAASAHLDGWSGLLGRALVEQTWKQEFDCFERCLRLSLAPVISIESVTWRDADGQISTVADTNYLLRTDASGSYVRFDDGYTFPTGLHESAAVAVTYVAGYPNTEGDTPASTVPAALKAAILLMVAHWFNNREAVSADGLSEVPASAHALIAPYRRPLL